MHIKSMTLRMTQFAAKVFISTTFLIVVVFSFAYGQQTAKIKEGNKEVIIKSLSEIKTANNSQDKTMLSIWLSYFNNYSNLISAFATVLAVFAALYLGDWKERLRKPKLNVYFRKNKEYPYFHKLAFEPLYPPLSINDKNVYFHRPGITLRVKIMNDGKTTANNAFAKIEKMEFYDDKDRVGIPRYYHPTTVKWSGELYDKSVDIAPSSYFFLDVFWAKNETTEEILFFNKERLRDNIGYEIDEDILKENVRHINPEEKIYWNVWINPEHERGIPKEYSFQGTIKAYFIIYADNCEPKRFEAIITWNYDKWDKPDVIIKRGHHIIDKDIGGVYNDV